MLTNQKIKSRDEVSKIIAGLNKQNKITGFTSGAFDLLHAGHVDYLEKARMQCDYLVVGVNSDKSVKAYKSPKRPVVSQDMRARLIAGLACVDDVFIFDELNNNKNIEELHPKIYFKAADYSKDKLSSAAIVEAYGGEVKLIELTPALSTSSIIEDVALRFHPASVDEDKIPRKEKAPAVFIDRDGTINVLIHYLHEVEKFELIEGAMEALRAFEKAGYRLVIVTNQPGIGLGYFSKEDFFQCNKALLKACTAAGVGIDKIYFCPHSKADNCTCRKPAIGMIERAIREMDIDLKKSYVIGDMTSDIMLAKNAGCRSVLVKTGQGGSDGLYGVKPDFIFDNLLQASKELLK